MFNKKIRGDNPTKRTQELILKTIQDSDKPLSLSSVAEKTNKSIQQVKSSIEFFENLGIIQTISSEGGTTFVFRKGLSQENGITN